MARNRPEIDLPAEDIRLLKGLKAKLDKLFPDEAEGLRASRVAGSGGHDASRSLDSALREGLRQMLQEELSPLLRDAAATIREGLVQPGRGQSEAAGRLLTVEDVAQRCGVTEPTVRGWIKSGGLRALTPGTGRVYRVRREDLDAFLARHPGNEGEPPDVDDEVERILSREHVRARSDKKQG